MGRGWGIMKIQLYYLEGCPNYQKAHNILKEVLAEQGIKTEVELIKVETEEDARRHRFIGSPTIKINGVDVEPGVQDVRQFSLGCRVYLNNGAHQGFPPKAMLVQAIKDLTRG
jgi:glutaredoxin